VDLSIIIVNWNTCDLLRSCLESVFSTVVGPRFEVLVVDNHSNDGSSDMVAKDFPRVHLLRNLANVGFARANNQAIAKCTGRSVLLLNSDAVLLPHTAELMLQVLDDRPGVGIVGAQLLNPDRTFQGSYADFPSITGELLLATKLFRLFYPATYPNYPREQSQVDRAVDWVSGACLMARRAAIDSAGGLDEDYFMYSEETDWCYRMQRKGWLVYYCAAACVLHWGSQSSKRVPERRRGLVYRSKWLFMRKHRGALAATAFGVALWVVSALKLCMWAARGLRSSTDMRAVANQHVRSYAKVLFELTRAEM
jgi:N-acetylglucosaminyl-diphospho-decaprenol L-rhamnosyltransferase